MSKPNEYDIGDLVEVKATFDRNGTPVSPATVICTVRAPSGTTTIPSVTGGSAVYTAETEPDEHGTWWYAFDGGPDIKASGEKYFVVRKREVPR